MLWVCFPVCPLCSPALLRPAVFHVFLWMAASPSADFWRHFETVCVQIKITYMGALHVVIPGPGCPGQSVCRPPTTGAVHQVLLALTASSSCWPSGCCLTPTSPLSPGVSVTSSNTGVPDISGSVYSKTQVSVCEWAGVHCWGREASLGNEVSSPWISQPGRREILDLSCLREIPNPERDIGRDSVLCTAC